MTAKIEKAQDPAAASRRVEKLPAGTYLQYLGFGQAGSVRTYQFRRIARGETPIEYSMQAEMALFSKHRVGIQDGPALCLHILSERSDASGTPAPPMKNSLTDADMLAHLARRPAPQAKGGFKPKSHVFPVT